jgi:ABC-type antimicrobial peptide transport system permease subunit
VDLVTPRFFETIGVPIVAGRDFDERDTQTAPPVVVINEALAQALFRGAPALGRTLRVPGDPHQRIFTVIGVVANTCYYDLHAQPGPAAWIGLLQETPYMPTLHVRAATGDVASMVSAVRQEFDAIDKGFPIFNIKTLEGRVEDSLARERMIANISGTFGALALVLAGVGLYGLLAYSVSQRQRDIGIRLALGSSSGAVLRGVAREAAVLVIWGGLAGLAIAIGGGRLASPYLFGVAQFDPGVLLASAGALGVIALLAVSVPAVRATRVDPMLALKAE